MPQYLAPGVYVEEIAGPRTIQGVSTSTAAFVGPTRFGPTSGRPELLTSYLDFVRIYGDAVDLAFVDNGPSPNYLAMGVKGFFDEGGSSLYVVRTFNYAATAPKGDHGSAPIPADGSGTPKLLLRARFPGQAGNLRVTLTLRVGKNVLLAQSTGAVLSRVREFDTVWAVPHAGTPGVYVVRRDATTGVLGLAGGAAALALADTVSVFPLTALVEAQRPTVDGQGLPAFGAPLAVGEFGFDPRAAGSITTVLTANPAARGDALTVPVALEGVDDLDASDDALPVALAEALFGAAVLGTAAQSNVPVQERQRLVSLLHGTDGNSPTVVQYEGSPTFADYEDDPTALPFNGLLALEAVDDVSIVAAPGSSTGWKAAGDAGVAQAVNNAVISHCERLLYRVAALDTPPRYLPDQALDLRNQRSSTHAALYYPWITVSSPVDGQRVSVPPAAYAAGIWARSDNARGVVKAPANEVVRSALDFEFRLNKAQQELLNPEGVNCLRFFPGPGFLVWGARTVSDDPQWKYLSVRRYFNFLEKSIDEGTRWVVFEINGPALWDAVRHTVEGFLTNEWKSGALLGSKPEQAFFVRCDATTMTADDLDNGRLVCVIGVAVAKPAEFVIFRISQFTATPTA